MMEEEYVANQERLKPKEEQENEERTKLDELRGTPMDVGKEEEEIKFDVGETDIFFIRRRET
jgi:26S proteasome regulatory subunit T2